MAVWSTVGRNLSLVQYLCCMPAGQTQTGTCSRLVNPRLLILMEACVQVRAEGVLQTAPPTSRWVLQQKAQ